ncbi:MAG: citrate (Si)-synthase [Chlamydiae bacterium]|nr:citrate (Si)-synthase [Chlamydiota bacterium]
MSKVLFEVKEENLETGLRGFPVGYCTTSYVDPQEGLFYAGKPIEELAFREPLEVVYLLLYGKEGNKRELEEFRADLKKRNHCSKEVIRHIHELPRKGHPMKMFSCALLILGMMEGKNDYREDCLNLIAKIPHLAATVINYFAGWGETPESRPELGYMENFTRMVNVPNKKEENLKEVFRLFNILHYDHGGGNLSVFVGKAVASGLEDLYGSMCAAMCALAGPKHGRANQDCLEFVQEALKTLGQNATLKDVENFIRKRKEQKKLIFGFGHAVLRIEDPRAKIQYEFAKKHYGNNPLVKMALLLREAGSKVLSEDTKITDPHPNVDAISGTLLTAAGFGYPEFYTILFGMARVVGIAIQIVYERCEARGGKGTPIVRPKYIYKPRFP